MNVVDVVSVPGHDNRSLLPAWDSNYPFFANAWIPDYEIFCVHWDMYYTQSDMIAR